MEAFGPTGGSLHLMLAALLVVYGVHEAVALKTSSSSLLTLASPAR